MAQLPSCHNVDIPEGKGHGYAQSRYNLSSNRHGHLFIGYIDIPVHTYHTYLTYKYLFTRQRACSEGLIFVMIRMTGYGSLYAAALGNFCTERVAFYRFYSQQCQSWYYMFEWVLSRLGMMAETSGEDRVMMFIYLLIFAVGHASEGWVSFLDPIRAPNVSIAPDTLVLNLQVQISSIPRVRCRTRLQNNVTYYMILLTEGDLH